MSGINSLLGKILLTLEKKDKCVVSICGAIGVGKTTIIPHLALLLRENGISVTVVNENVHEWSKILKMFYEDQARWAYTLQTSVLVSRVNAFENRDKDAQVVLVERGIDTDKIFADMLFDDGKMSEQEYEMYLKWWELWSRFISYDPDITVAIECSLATSMERIKKRARDGESLVSESYQQSLIRYHEQFYSEKDIVRIDSEDDYNSMTRDIANLITCVNVTKEAFQNIAIKLELVKLINSDFAIIQLEENKKSEFEDALMTKLKEQETHIKKAINNGYTKIICVGGINFRSLLSNPAFKMIMGDKIFKLIITCIEGYIEDNCIRNVYVSSLEDISRE